MKAGRPKGTKVSLCACGGRVSGKGKSATCPWCGRRVAFSKKKTAAKATA